MFKRAGLASLLLVGAATLASCNDGYGYSGVSVGYGNSWDPYYGGFSADPYWGWCDGYYYPGTGVYVYDRARRRHRWGTSARDHWRDRSRTWRNAHRDMKPVWRDYNGPRWDRDGRGRPGHGDHGGRHGHHGG